jgi:hypothetical protein
MTLPNFLIVGAAKSGTTSLWTYLQQHPQIFMPSNKEPNFFALEGLKLPPFPGAADAKTLYEKIYKYSITDFESYQALFQEVSQEIAIGEASIPYLYFPEAAERIKQYIPQVKIIAILRNPIDRLYSHYLMIRDNYCLEPLSLAQALQQENERIRNNWGWDWHYVRLGLYHTQVKRYFDLFEPQQIKIYLYEDFCFNPVGVFQDICCHIGVDSSFIPDLSQRSKVSGRPRSQKLHRLLNQPNRIQKSLQRALPKTTYKRVVALGNHWNIIPTVPMASELRQALKDVFREDIVKLQTLIRRDLSAWMS